MSADRSTVGQAKAVVGTGFSCSECFKEFPTEKERDKHFRRHRIHDYACDICGAKVKTQELLRKHKLSHAPKATKTPWYCKLCDKYFKTKKILGQHNRSTHSQGTPWAEHPCKYCGSIFKNKQILMRHENAHRTGTILASGKLATMQNIAEENQAKSTTALPTSAASPHDSLDRSQPTQGVEAEEGGDTDEDEAEDELANPELKKLRALAPIGSAAIKKRLQLIRSITQSHLATSNPEQPSSMQELHMGHNLRAFEAAQLVEPLPSIRNPTLDPSDNLKRLLEQPARRKILVAQIASETDPGIIDHVAFEDQNDISYSTAALQDTCEIDMGSLRLPKDGNRHIVQFMGRLLMRMPVLLRELSMNHKQWLLSAALRLTMNEFPKFKLTLPTPRLTLASNKTYCTIEVAGYDHSRSQAWTSQLKVPVAELDAKKKVAIFDEGRYVFDTDHVDVKSASGDTSKEQLAIALRVVKLLATKSHSFIGTEEQCKQDASFTIHAYGYGSYMAHKGWLVRRRAEVAHGPWARDAFWSHKQAGENTVLIPTAWMRTEMQGNDNPIYVPSAEVEGTFHVVNSMLKAMEAGNDADTVWGIGSAQADAIARDYDSQTLPSPVPACPSDCEPDKLHVCPECLTIRVHADLEATTIFYYAICSSCRTKFEPPPQGVSLKGGIVGAHLFAHLTKENQVANGKKTAEQIVKQCNQILDDISFLKISDTKFWDAYVDQVLDTKAPKTKTWDGQTFNAKFPSIDAILAVVIGMDGLTHYHERWNITITSDSINRMMKHYPKVLLNAILQFMEAATQGDAGVAVYENAIAIFRNCLINHMEYGKLGHSQQASRIGNVPPGNMSAITRSFQTAELLPRTVPNQQVWRLLPKGDIGTAEERASWLPPCHDWLSRQLNWAAEEVFGEEAPTYRKFWMRTDASGREVFFPFSQYSVVLEWNWWSLFSLLTLKAKRTVEECQRPHSHIEPIPVYSVEELLLVVAYLWMYMIKQDIDCGKPRYDLGRDEAGLIPHPVINTLLCASLGHRWPGKTEYLGLHGFDTASADKVVFVPDECGMKWETQACNFLKFKYDLKTLDPVFAQLPKIRRANLVPGQTKPLLPTMDPKIPLRDELAFEATARASTVVKAVQNLDPQAIRLLRDATSALKSEAAEADEARAAAGIVEQAADSEESGTGDDFMDNTFFEDVDIDQLLENTQRPPCRNMTNLGSTCYLSSVLQVMANVPQLRGLLASDAEFNTDTGRNPNLMKNLTDPDGVHHVSFYFGLQGLFKLLTRQGQQLDDVDTQQILDTSSNVTSAATWQNEKNDSAAYYSFALDRIDCMLDKSPKIDQPWFAEKLDRGGFRRRPAYRPEELQDQEHEADLSEGLPLGRSSTRKPSDTSAWSLAGASPFGSHVSCLSGCNTSRTFQYSGQIMFKFKPDFFSKMTVPLWQLAQWNLSQEIDPAQESYRNCPNEKLHAGQLDSEKGMFKGRYVRVTRAPLIFAVEVSRTRKPKATPGKEVSLSELLKLQQEAEEKPFMHRISDYGRINISDWSKDAPALPDKPFSEAAMSSDEVLTDPSLQAEYEVQAIVAYSNNIKHYVAFVLLEAGWAYFNDMDAYPVWRDPFQDWPQGFAETMLWYKRVGELPPSTFAKDSKAQEDSDAMQGLEPVEKAPAPQAPFDADKLAEWSAALNQEIREVKEAKLKSDANASMFKQLYEEEVEAREKEESLDPLAKLEKALADVPATDAKGILPVVNERLFPRLRVRKSRKSSRLLDDEKVFESGSRQRKTPFLKALRKFTGGNLLTDSQAARADTPRSQRSQDTDRSVLRHTGPRTTPPRTSPHSGASRGSPEGPAPTSARRGHHDWKNRARRVSRYFGVRKSDSVKPIASRAKSSQEDSKRASTTEGSLTDTATGTNGPSRAPTPTPAPLIDQLTDPHRDEKLKQAAAMGSATKKHTPANPVTPRQSESSAENPFRVSRVARTPTAHGQQTPATAIRQPQESSSGAIEVRKSTEGRRRGPVRVIQSESDSDVREVPPPRSKPAYKPPLTAGEAAKRPRSISRASGTSAQQAALAGTGQSSTGAGSAHSTPTRGLPRSQAHPNLVSQFFTRKLKRKERNGNGENEKAKDDGGSERKKDKESEGDDDSMDVD